MAGHLPATALNNQNLLRALEVFVVALIWLFFFRIIRAVWVEVRPPKVRGADASGDGGSRRERSGRFHLKVIEPASYRGQVYDLNDEITVGRAAGCAVHVEDAYTSNLHARVFRRDGTVWVEDLGSTNGTWVNAERIDGPTRLGRGDLLQVGGTVFEMAR
ncbi:MAG TPA: FHA domain-containing protein [Acidimicrobiales bacterium]|nr:FHA domain-containing protein [Acidimicrobiales bacterium]